MTSGINAPNHAMAHALRAEIDRTDAASDAPIPAMAPPAAPVCRRQRLR